MRPVERGKRLVKPGALVLVQSGQRVQKVGPAIVLVAVFRLVEQHDFRREDGPSAGVVEEGILKAQPNR